MKRILFLASFLFLFSISSTDAIAPSKPQVITNFEPVHIPNPRPQPSLLIPQPIVVYTKTVAGAKAYALDKIGRTQFSCLDKLFTRESNWRTFAKNSFSGAYGIPQALPGSKMAISGADWRTNPVTQVKWGLRYIKARYGTACNAWRHSENYGWY